MVESSHSVSQEPSEQDRNASIDLSKQPARDPEEFFLGVSHKEPSKVGDMPWVVVYKLTLRESMRKAGLVILILQGGETLSPLVL